MTLYLNALGIVNALGHGKQQVLANLLAGRTDGIAILDDILVNNTPIPFGLVKTTLETVPNNLNNMASRNLALSLTALHEIDADIRAAIQTFGPDRVAVVAATSTSGIAEGERAVDVLTQDGWIPADYRFGRQEIGAVSEAIAAHYGLEGPALTVSTACSSSAKAFASAARLIEGGLADAVVVGGTDALCRLTVNGFFSLSALSTQTCNPFSLNRQGTVLGEGAAYFLLSRVPGPIILGGVGESSDAHNMTAPDPEGRGAMLAMQSALQAAMLAPDQISYINLHGTGTRLNDSAEAAAVANLFGPAVACSSSKAQVGHTLGAAGATEVGLCWLALSDLNQKKYLPPHLWDGVVDSALPPLAFVSLGQTLPDDGAIWCMSNSYAFGGSNASVIIGRLA